MISLENIVELEIGGAVSEPIRDGKLYVSRLENTKTGKPVYLVGSKCTGMAGGMTCWSPKAAMKLVASDRAYARKNPLRQKGGI